MYRGVLHYEIFIKALNKLPRKYWPKRVKSEFVSQICFANYWEKEPYNNTAEENSFE